MLPSEELAYPIRQAEATRKRSPPSAAVDPPFGNPSARVDFHLPIFKEVVSFRCYTISSMAVYKVPQDVEAEDKLLGPFSFKQFIFLIIAIGSIAIAYGLSQILLPLAIIPLPFIIFFGALALPLRKDQPMEVYLAAIISFIMKPKIRIWEPDGVEALIEVIAPRNEEKQYGKGYSQEEVNKRLSYLANLVDSRGWSVRGVDPDSSMQSDLYNEAQATDDFMDDSGARARNIDSLLAQTDNRRRQELVAKMNEPAVVQPQPIQPAQPAPEVNLQAPTTVQQPAITPPAYSYEQPQFMQVPETPEQLMVSPSYTPMSVIQPQTPDEDIQLVINPYPSMNQSVIRPLSQQPVAPTAQTVVQPTPVVAQPQTTVAAPEIQPRPKPEPVPEPPSPAIIDLANNHADLSIETLQREANRIKQKEEESQEVVISFR